MQWAASSDGTLVLNYSIAMRDGCPQRGLSADGSMLCLIDEDEEDVHCAVVLDTATGERRGEVKYCPIRPSSKATSSDRYGTMIPPFTQDVV